jgi:hypothetical protein
MRRRELIGTACLAGAGALAGATQAARAAEGAGGAREILELRLYKAEKGEMRDRLDKFIAEAAIPAWNRLGMKPVGVFVMQDESTADLWVLVPHKTLEGFMTLGFRFVE